MDAKHHYMNGGWGEDLNDHRDNPWTPRGAPREVRKAYARFQLRAAVWAALTVIAALITASALTANKFNIVLFIAGIAVWVLPVGMVLGIQGLRLRRWRLSMTNTPATAEVTQPEADLGAREP